MADWMALTTRSGNRPAFAGRRRGRPRGARNVMPRTKKDFQQDKQIKQVKGKVRKIQSEVDLGHKDTFVDAVRAVSDAASTTNVILLNGLVQGTTDLTRLKTDVNFTSIQMRGRVVLANTNLNGSTVRMIIVMDRQSNGTAPTQALLLDSTVITEIIEAPYNHSVFPRFKILYDQKITVNPMMVVTTVGGSTTVSNTTQVAFDFRRKINPSKKNCTNYGLGNAGTVADISSNSIYLFLLSEDSAASTIAPFVTAGVRCYFKDA